MSADSGPGNREVARRLFAAEFDDASLSYSESDEERAPNYVVTPTGARVNRLFAVGVLTEVEQVNEDSVRGRVVDPMGAFVTYAGQYQPDEHAFLNRTEPPTFVALAGKARTFEPEDSNRVFTSVRPESINKVDADTRDSWVVTAAERTLERIAVFAEALESDARGEHLRTALEAAGVDASLAAGIPKAIEHYDTGPAYLEAVRTLAVEAVEQVAGDRDSVGSLQTLPDDETPTELGPLPDVELSLEAVELSELDEEETESTEPDDFEVEPETDVESGAEPESAESEEESEEESEPEPEPEPTASESESEPVSAAAETEQQPTEPETESESEREPEASGSVTEAEPTETTEAEPTETAEAEEPADTEPKTPAAGDDELSDFDGESVQETVEQEGEELGDFDPTDSTDDDEALTEEERREVEEEFGTDFSTGSEVGEPGEAGIDVPTSEEELENLEEEVVDNGDADESEEPEEPSDGGDDASAEDVDLESVVVDTMSELDDGDGVSHDALVDAVVEEYGVDADAVDDAVQDAMMSGKCYEPDEGTLKAI
ncbi:hypothetical protein Halar_1454 [halophilic archaeon DL31]|nr:hypothetical protein Halar_1454 [halophilic archaeon DL31]